MASLPEGFHMVQDMAQSARSVYAHLCDQAAQWTDFRERFFNVFDTRSTEMSVRSIAAPGTGINFAYSTTGILLENPRRKGFMLFNSGAATDKVHIKLGRSPFNDTEDYSFFILGGTQAIVSGPNGDFPTWRGPVYAYWSVAAAGAQLKVTEFV